jgi:predicted nucleic acid-binding protein
VTFLDSSAIVDMLAEEQETVTVVESHGEPYLTSTICVYEVIEGRLGSGETDVAAVREQFGGVRALDFTEELAVEAGRLQDAMYDDGEPMAVRDLYVAATARSTGDRLVVADADFETERLRSEMDVTNVRQGGE